MDDTMACTTVESVDSVGAESFSLEKGLEAIFSSQTSPEHSTEGLNKKKYVLINRMKAMVAKHYPEILLSCKSIKGLEGESSRINACLIKYRTILHSLSNVPPLTKFESAVASAGPAVLSVEHSNELMIFQQKLEDLSAQILEQRFVLAVQTIESTVDMLKNSKHLVPHEAELRKASQQLVAVLLTKLKTSKSSNSERRHLYQLLIRLGQHSTALSSFFDWHSRLARERIRAADTMVDSLSTYARELSRLWMRGITNATHQFQLLFHKQNRIDSLVVWACGELDLLAQCLQERLFTGDVALSLLAECLLNVFASSKQLAAEGLDLSFVLEKKLEQPLLARIRSFFGASCDAITVAIATDMMCCSSHTVAAAKHSHSDVLFITSSAIHLYDKIAIMLRETVLLIPSESSLYPNLCGFIAPVLVAGFIRCIDQYMTGLLIRYHDDSLSDSSLVAVLCNMRAVAEDLLPRLIENMSQQFSVPFLSSSSLLAPLHELRSRFQRNLVTEAHYFVQTRPEMWLREFAPQWPLFAGVATTRNPQPSASARIIVSHFDKVQENLKKILSNELFESICSMCVMELFRTMGCRPVWKDLPSNCMTFSNVLQLHVDALFMEGSLRSLVHSASQERLRVLLQRVLEQARMRCSESEADLDERLQELSLISFDAYNTRTDDDSLTELDAGATSPAG